MAERAPRMPGETITARARAGLFRCIGCGRQATPKAHTYCRVCRARLADGTPLDADDFPTVAEVLRLRALLPSDHGQAPRWGPGRPHRPRWDRGE